MHAQSTRYTDIESIGNGLVPGIIFVTLGIDNSRKKGRKEDAAKSLRCRVRTGRSRRIYNCRDFFTQFLLDITVIKISRLRFLEV